MTPFASRLSAYSKLMVVCSFIKALEYETYGASGQDADHATAVAPILEPDHGARPMDNLPKGFV